MGGTYEGSNDLLPEIDLGERQEPDTSDFRDWKRTPPDVREHKGKLLTTTDPIKVERANQQHYALENLIAKLCQESGGRCQSNRHVDVVATFNAVAVLFEMKSCTLSSLKPQLRRAVSQLLEYRYLYRKRLAPEIFLCAVIERKPRGGDGWLPGYLSDLKIGLIWKNDTDERLNCTEFTRNTLRNAIPKIVDPDFGPTDG